MTKPNPELIDDENPEWTDEVFAEARPAAEVLGEAFMAKARRGRPKSSFEGGIDEFFEVLRGLPTRASSSPIRATSRSIISACCASKASLSASLRM